MTNVLVIAASDIGRVLRERESLFWLFVGPLIFTVFFGLLFRPSAPAKPRLAIVNQDATQAVANRIRLLVERDGVDARPAATVGGRVLTLVVPPGADAAIKAGTEASFVLHAGAEETNTERSLRFTIQKALTRLALGAMPEAGGVEGAPGPAGGSATTAGPAVPEGPLMIRDASIGLVRRDQTAGFQRSVPAYLVMFVFLNLLVSGAGIAEDRASGRLRRIAVAPVSRASIVLGKLLGRFVIGWIQIVYMLGFGLLVGIRWAEHPWTFLAFLSVFALASASLGILLGTLFDDPDKCASIAIWVAILLAPIGGLWWPLEIVSPGMRRLAYVVPTGWAMEGVNAMLAFGAGAWEVAPFGLALLGLFAASFGLAARRLRP